MLARQAIPIWINECFKFLISFMMVGVFITFIAESDLVIYIWRDAPFSCILLITFNHSCPGQCQNIQVKGQATSFIYSYYSGGAVMGMSMLVVRHNQWSAISCLVMLG